MRTSSPVIADLSRWGPHQALGVPTLAASQDYCRGLAHTHYENFTAVSWLLPRPFRQHLCNVYAYCRWADDLADEISDPAQSLRLLDWWRDELDACYRGELRHPVFVALADTVHSFAIPAEPFVRLLTAFRQDQQPVRYQSFDELLEYCRRSADPVGEIVLYLGHSHSAENVELSNKICSGLQLANFWQDVARDFDRGRVYLPTHSLGEFGYSDAMLSERTYNSAFCRMLEREVDRADAMLSAGHPLVAKVQKQLRMPVAMFVGGGRAILERIRGIQYNVWRERPTLTRWDKLCIAARAWRAARRH